MASPASCLQPVLPTKGLHKAPRLCVLYICDRSYISVNTEAEQKWCAQSNRWGTLSTSAIPSFWYLLSSATTPCCFLLQEVIKQKIGHVELRAHIMLHAAKCVLIFVQAVIILSTSYYSAPWTVFPFLNILWTSCILFTWGPSKCLKCLIHHQT